MPAKLSRSASSASAIGGQVEQPRGDHAAAPPDLGDVGEVEVEALVLGQLLRVAVAQDVEAFGIGLHQAVLDAVVDHLDEVAGAGRPGVDVAALGARIGVLAARRARDVAEPGARRLKIGSSRVDRLLRAADHHAVAALSPQTPPEVPTST